MKSYSDRLSKALTANNTWIHLITIIVIAFMFQMTIVDHFSMVYINEKKWRVLIHMVLRMVFYYSPMLLYAGFRDFIGKALSRTVQWILWGVIFVGYPIVLSTWDIFSSTFPVLMASELLTMIGWVLAVADLVSNPHSKVELKSRLSSFFEKNSIEWAVFALFVFMTIRSSIGIIQFNDVDTSFWFVLPQMFVLMLLHYLFYRINHYFLINKVYKAKGVIYYGAAFLGLVIVFFVPVMLTYFYLPDLRSLCKLNLGEKWIGPEAPSFFWTIYLSSVTSLMLLTIPLSIVVQWLLQSQNIALLQKENSDTELNLLKQQINPHFFFNTLNNVYAMSLTNDKNTSESILQLSDLMRYTIYRGRETEVPLKDEIKYLQDYLQLMKMRVADGLDVSFDHRVEDEDVRVPPLLFVILIENAFKHGVEKSDSDSFVHIEIRQEGGKILFGCINSKEEEQICENGGLGLSNLERRLDLLYPGKHKLETVDDGNRYEAHLTIDLEA